MRSVSLFFRFYAALVILAAIAVTIFFSRNLPFGLPPDELWHFRVAEFVSQNGIFSFQQTPEMAWAGAYTRTAHLYHQILAVFLPPKEVNVWLTSFGWARFFNVILSSGNFLLLFVLFKRVSGHVAGGAIGVLIFANTSMVPVLGGSVSYDNAALTFSILLLLTSVTYLKMPSVADALKVVLVVSLGLLTKIVFIPLAVFAACILFASYARSGFPRFKSTALQKTIGFRILLVSTLAAAALASSFYSTNFLKFGRLAPTCEAVIGKEACLKNHGGSQSEHTFTTKNVNVERMSFFSFAPKYFLQLGKSWNDYFCHRYLRFFAWDWKHLGFALFLLFSASWAVRCAWAEKATWLPEVGVFLLFIGALSGAALLENYLSYLRLGQFGPAIQPRYHFASYVALIAACLRLFFATKRSHSVTLCFVVLASYAFSFQGVRHFVRHAGPEWFMTGEAKFP